MKRSQINQAIRKALSCFHQYSWALPPNPRWDVTDFGLGDFEKFGLVLVNLSEEAEYCEKIMYAEQGQVTPAHCHRVKKEDIIVRNGELMVQVWNDAPPQANGFFEIQINGQKRTVASSEKITLRSGHRITITPGIYHEFMPLSSTCIIGEVSTANDDENDNFFANPDIGRFSKIEEDEMPMARLVGE